MYVVIRVGYGRWCNASQAMLDKVVWCMDKVVTWGNAVGCVDMLNEGIVDMVIRCLPYSFRGLVIH